MNEPQTTFTSTFEVNETDRVQVILNLEPTPHCDIVITGGPDSNPEFLSLP